MEGMGLEGLEFIIDERDEMLYANNTKAWYKATFAEIEADTEEPIFDYLFDLDNVLDAEMKADIENVQEILLNGIKNYNKATYVDLVEDNSRKLIHYELEYNIYNIAKEIFEYGNDKQDEPVYDDFEDFISEIDLADIINLFKTFTIDVYFDAETNQIGRIELDLMNFMKNDVILNKISEEIDDEDIDIKKIFEYMTYQLNYQIIMYG